MDHSLSGKRGMPSKSGQWSTLTLNEVLVVSANSYKHIGSPSLWWRSLRQNAWLQNPSSFSAPNLTVWISWSAWVQGKEGYLRDWWIREAEPAQAWVLWSLSVPDLIGNEDDGLDLELRRKIQQGRVAIPSRGDSKAHKTPLWLSRKDRSKIKTQIHIPFCVQSYFHLWHLGATWSFLLAKVSLHLPSRKCHLSEKIFNKKENWDSLDVTIFIGLEFLFC